MDSAMQVRTFDTEAERSDLVYRLMRRGFRQVSPLAELQTGQFQLLNGTTDPSCFGGPRKFPIRWREEG